MPMLSTFGPGGGGGEGLCTDKETAGFTRQQILQKRTAAILYIYSWVMTGRCCLIMKCVLYTVSSTYRFVGSSEQKIMTIILQDIGHVFFKPATDIVRSVFAGTLCFRSSSFVHRIPSPESRIAPPQKKFEKFNYWKFGCHLGRTRGFGYKCVQIAHKIIKIFKKYL